MEGGKNGRFHFHAILNNVEQVKGCGVSKHAEKFAFELVVKDCLRSERNEAAERAMGLRYFYHPRISIALVNRSLDPSDEGDET